MQKDNNTSWGAVADWYDGVVESDDSYQAQVILPNLLRIIDIQKDETVIDIACGQGYFSRAISEAGADVVGIDIGENLIAIAKEKQDKQEKSDLNKNKKTEFKVGSAETLEGIEDNKFDKAVIVLALQNIENIQKAIASTARVLKPDGKFYIVLNHPSFRISGKTEWGFDEVKNIQYRRNDGYMSESKKEMIMNPGAEVSSQIKTISFHRPLQVYIKALAKAGFSITRIEEWISHKESQPGPRQMAEDKARKEFPMFMAIESNKLL
jgi:ubiquinone/menaquinone biosynthesis C-methylase UbiE